MGCVLCFNAEVINLSLLGENRSGAARAVPGVYLFAHMLRDIVSAGDVTRLKLSAGKKSVQVKRYVNMYVHAALLKR